MAISELGELTSIELRILTSLTDPQTSRDLFENLGMGYPYGIKVLRKLKNKKLIDHQQRGNYTYYFTIRTSETEDIYAAKATATGKSTYLFPFKGEWVDLYTTGRFLGRKNKVYPYPLLDLAFRILVNLRYNSYRKEQNMPTQRPYAEDMRKALEIRLASARTEILYVEEMLKAPIWSDNSTVWKIISNDIPDLESGKMNSDLLEKGIYKKS